MILPESMWKDYSTKEHLNVQYELAFGQSIIRTGSLVKFRNDRGQYKFRCLVHDPKIDTTWIEAFSVKTGKLHSFHVSRLVGPSLAKRSRRDKEIA
jgi:hypothetical protein